MRTALSTTLLVLTALAVLIFLSSAGPACAKRERLPLRFAHADHSAENCLTCHHNFADGSGRGPPCIDCHKTDPEIAAAIETDFHALCRNCHMTRHAAGKPAGPTRACSACHVPDERP